MRFVVCSDCKEYKPHTGHGLCSKCYERMRHKRDRKKRLALSKKWRINNREYKLKKDAEYRDKNRDKIRQRAKELYPERRKSILEYHYKWREENPKKHKAHWTIQNNIRLGNLQREPCIICGEMDAHAHHEDYDKPLDVVWLCSQHHAQRHQEMKSDLEEIKQWISRM